MAVFVERFLLAVFAAVFVANLMVNPVRMDWVQRIGVGLVCLGAAIFAGRTLENMRKPAVAPASPAPNAPPPAQQSEPQPKPHVDEPSPPQPKKADPMSDHKVHPPAQNVVTNNHGTVVQVAGDLNVKGGPPTAVELKADFEVTPLTFETTQNMPAPHALSFRVRARAYDHPKVYVRVVATAPLVDKYIARGPDGMRTMIASSVQGRVFEFTEGPPGLLRGEMIEFVLLSEQPVTTEKIEVEDSNPFNEVAAKNAVP